jgi:NADPH2:quinone reductase
VEGFVNAIQVHQYGGPEVLSYGERAAPEPGPGQVLVKLEAIGINFIDVYRRVGLYPVTLPFIPGEEAAGVVTALGPGVDDVHVGEHVAFTNVLGAYAEYAVVLAERLVPIPHGLDARQAAAAMLQGMTAHYLTHSTYPIQAGDRVLIHAAAGGAGLLLVQMAKRRGARVFGTVSTEAKAALAREAGADEIILYTQTDFEIEIKQLTDGRGVDAIYDSVGQTTFDKSLNCLRPRGYMVLFGQSSGPVAPLNPQILNAKGSLFLTRPTLGHYIATRAELLARAGDVLGWIAAGELKLRIDSEFPLAEAAEAHRKLESRATSGKLLLIP